MSSQDEDLKGRKDQPTKKARPRACDQCRRRKVRCNGGDIPIGSQCSNCAAFEYDCTYAKLPTKRFTDAEYVKSIEKELAELKKRLNSHPEEPSNRPSPATDYGDTGSPGSSTGHSASIASTSSQAAAADGAEEEAGLVEILQNLNLNVKHTYFVGRSSSIIFIRAAQALKEEYLASEFTGVVHGRAQIKDRQPEFLDATARLIQAKPPHPPSAFPAPALLSELVDHYFTRMNSTYPLLHRLVFEHGLRTGLHLKDGAFGSTVLMVCAIGARFSDDESVLPQGTKSWHWAGWQWFQQVNITYQFVHVSSPRVYDLQLCALLAWYMGMSPVPHGVYSIVGYGVRLAKDLGIHKRATYGSRLTADDELKKRAFWYLVAFDRMMSDKMGRPYNVHDEDFDVDFPIECDDEYWFSDSSGLTFAQPPDKPSKIASFNCMLRLTRIHAEAYRAMYYLHPARLHSEPEQTQKVVSDFDSELNAFIDSIPAHLKWDPHQENSIFMNQSALIYTGYYFLQIIIHRSFVPLPQRPSSVSFPSLAICTNAARSCIHIVDIQLAKMGKDQFPQTHWHPATLFTSATVLLLNVWNAKKNGLPIETSSDLKDILRANRILETFERRWLGAARLWYILEDVISVVTKSQPREDEHLKRKREQISVDEPPTPRPSHTGSSAGRPRSQQSPHIVDMDSSEQYASPSSSTTQSPHLRSDFASALPVYSDELRRIPVWPGLEENNAWNMASDDTYMGSEELFGADLTTPMFDPELEAIFANLIPDVTYSGAFTPFPQNGVSGAFNTPFTGYNYDTRMHQPQDDGYTVHNQLFGTPSDSSPYSTSSSSVPDGTPPMFRRD